MKATDWLGQFKEQVAATDIKLWYLTSTGEWKEINPDEEMPHGRMQLQVGFEYYDFYNTK